MRSVAFSPDGRTLASGAGEYAKPGTVMLWDTATGAQKQSLKGHTESANSVAFSPDGKTLASGSGYVILWDVATGGMQAILANFDAGKAWLAATPEGYYAGSDNVGEYIFWRVRNAVYPAEKYAAVYHRPDRVAAALAGKPAP